MVSLFLSGRRDIIETAINEVTIFVRKFRQANILQPYENRWLLLSEGGFSRSLLGLPVPPGRRTLLSWLRGRLSKLSGSGSVGPPGGPKGSKRGLIIALPKPAGPGMPPPENIGWLGPIKLPGDIGMPPGNG